MLSQVIGVIALKYDQISEPPRKTRLLLMCQMQLLASYVCRLIFSARIVVVCMSLSVIRTYRLATYSKIFFLNFDIPGVTAKFQSLFETARNPTILK